MLIYDLGAQSSLWGHSDSGTGVNIIAIFSIEIIVTQSQCLFFLLRVSDFIGQKRKKKKEEEKLYFPKNFTFETKQIGKKYSIYLRHCIL